MLAPCAAGRIELIIGPMFAGKTTELTRRFVRAQSQFLRCFFHCDPHTNALMPSWATCMNYDVIAVDDAHFFDDVVEFAELMANSGKTIYLAGLDGTFERRPFGQLLRLVACCESVTKMSAICPKTADEAFFTRRCVASTDVRLIGGLDKYFAASRAAYFGLERAGDIELVIGPVGCGKTAELHRILNRYVVARRPCLLLAPVDQKESGLRARVVRELPDRDTLARFGVIGVDDGQEYLGLGQWADELANQGKHVVVTANAADKAMEPYPVVLDLIPRCEKFRKLQGICAKTGLPAPFSGFDGGALVAMSRSAMLVGSFQS
jgi:thymidine kinase